MTACALRLGPYTLLDTARMHQRAHTVDSAFRKLCIRHAQVAPAHAGTELGIGDAILVKALAEATGRARDKVQHPCTCCCTTHNKDLSRGT